MLEAKFQAEVLWLLRKMGCLCAKQKDRSMPDYLVVIPGGGSLFIEFKSSTGKLSKLQSSRVDKLRRLGITVFVSSPKNPWVVLQIMRVCTLYGGKKYKAAMLNDISAVLLLGEDPKLGWGKPLKEFLIATIEAVSRSEVGVAGVKHVLLRLWEQE